MSLPLILRIFKDNQIKEVKQFHLDQIVIGHNAEVDLDLNDSQVSAIHAMIEKRDDRFYICDLGSQSGTLKNGVQVVDEPIDSGDEIQIGNFILHFNIGIPKPRMKAPEMAFQSESQIVPQISISDTKSDYKAVPVDNVAPIAPTIQKSKPIFNSPSEISKSINSGASKAESLNSKLDNSKLEPTSFLYQSVVSKKTFAPPSAHKDINQIFKPTRGTILQISVAWKERVLETYHFSSSATKITVGPTSKSQIILPSRLIQSEFTLIESVSSSGATVNVKPEMSGDLVTSGGGVLTLADLDRKSRLQRRGSFSQIKLDQNEVLRLCLAGDQINIFIRYVPQTKKPNLLPFVPLTIGEIASVLISIGLVSLLALYVKINTVDTDKGKAEEEQIRIAQIIYKAPNVPKPPAVVENKIPEPIPQVEKPKEPPKQVEMGKKTVESEKGENSLKTSEKVADKANKVAAGAKSPGQASDVRPNNKLNKPKKFTSTKQGGAIKLGDQAGSNAGQSAPVDPTKFGLAGALTGGGTRSKLDQVVSGTDGIIGDSSKSTGQVGFGANRPGDDFGSQFKDVGAGGKGTATEGISGGITKGRSTGVGSYGSGGSGLGDRTGIEVSSPGFSSFSGTIDREAVLRVIKSHHPDIVRCYEKELRFKPDLGGKIIINFLIDDQGRAIKVNVKSSTVGDTGVESCIVNEYQSWRFPEAPSGDVANVSFPYTFTKKK